MCYLAFGQRECCSETSILSFWLPSFTFNLAANQYDRPTIKIWSGRKTELFVYDLHYIPSSRTEKTPVQAPWFLPPSTLLTWLLLLHEKLHWTLLNPTRVLQHLLSFRHDDRSLLRLAVAVAAMWFTGQWSVVMEPTRQGFFLQSQCNFCPTQILPPPQKHTHAHTHTHIHTHARTHHMHTKTHIHTNPTLWGIIQWQPICWRGYTFLFFYSLFIYRFCFYKAICLVADRRGKY